MSRCLPVGATRAATATSRLRRDRDVAVAARAAPTVGYHGFDRDHASAIKAA
ncbi:hypothetical protein LC55x_2153 [Lysobacter capsici]|nr:hypothetical protein LC55x_2153 [Lysobacter capsici]